MVVRSFYDDIISDLQKKPLRILDLGSGIKFALEKKIHDIRNGIDIIDCADINELDKTPSYISSYHKLDLEENVFLGEYDIVFCFEVVEHVDRGDVLLQNCFDNLKKGGILYLSHPNLSSLYGRIELLFGIQPHVLEAFNDNPNAGTAFMGKKNNPHNNSIHHIRGITYKAMKEELMKKGFNIKNVYGQDNALKFLKCFPKLSSVIGYKAVKN